MLITAITPVTGSKFALLIAVAWATLFAAAGQAAVNGDFAGLIDIGRGRKMYLECRGSGSPAVVLVAGLKASAGDWNDAKPSGPTVFAAVAKFTRVCAYDRPGTPVGEKPSRSDPVPQPTTAEDAVSDLHALLSAAGVAGPYVLVGHSYGARAYHRNTWSGDSNRDGARLGSIGR
jgi:pimeloyl-ACP methyl ester carboxylesterase